ncbi:MAG TPA: hypothetical protein VH593_04665, partial [Ktedonobacteraceae bacterium]
EVSRSAGLYLAALLLGSLIALLFALPAYQFNTVLHRCISVLKAVWHYVGVWKDRRERFAPFAAEIVVRMIA